LIVDGLTWDSEHKQMDSLFSIGDLDNPLKIDKLLLNRDRPPKEWFYIPAILLLALVMMMQRSRIRRFGHPVPVEDD